MLVAAPLHLSAQARMTPNEVPTGSDSERIEAAIASAVSSGANSITIPRINRLRPEGKWLIERAIVLPSDFTLRLEDCWIQLAPGTRDNLITNSGSRTEPATGNENIRIIGEGNAVLCGGTESHWEVPGDRNGHRSIGVLLRDVRNFTISGFKMVETQMWGISVENGCAFGRIEKIEFANTNKYPNQDGVNVRRGCHDITVDQITGNTGDDSVAITALRARQPAGPGGDPRTGRIVDNGTKDDVYNITISNIRTRVVGGHQIVRILNHDGVKIYNVSIDHVMDTSAAEEKRPRAAVKIGDVRYFAASKAALGDTSRIMVSNVMSRAESVIQIQGTLRDARFTNIYGYGGNKHLVEYGTEPVENVEIEAKQWK